MKPKLPRWFVWLFPSLAYCGWLAFVVFVGGCVALACVAVSCIETALNNLAPEIRRQLTESTNRATWFVNVRTTNQSFQVCLVTNMPAKPELYTVYRETSTDGRTWTYYDNLSDAYGPAAILWQNAAWAQQFMPITEEPMRFFKTVTIKQPCQ